MMKKIFAFAIAALALASCSKDKEFTAPAGYELNNTKALYKDAFIKEFGQPAATQTWGFAQTSRTAYPNSNMWESEGYIVPAAITQDEVEKVLAVFNEKEEGEQVALVDWDCFFVQQVFKGTASYIAGNGGTVVGGNQMDWLCAYDPTGHEETVYWAEYNWQPTVIVNHDDHVYNFNSASGSIQLMVNSSTQRFGFKSSTDNGHVFYNFRMEEIDGNYYVGFDFEAAGQNPNEQVARDYIYNDWIVKIVPGKGTSDKVKEQGMIICEDLGTIGDFDFNDVVFFAKVWESGKTEITLLAAGGTLELSVAGQEVHEAMLGAENAKNANGLYKMINTGVDATAEPYYFEAATKYSSLVNIPVIVKKVDEAGNITSYELSAERGKAPQKICVPVGFKWCKEYKSLVKAYPGFKDWTTGASDTWAGEYVPEFVMSIAY